MAGHLSGQRNYSGGLSKGQGSHQPPVSQQSRGDLHGCDTKSSRRQDGAKAFARAITTTTDGWTCTLLFGATTCSCITMMTELSRMSPRRLDSGMMICAGVR